MRSRTSSPFPSCPSGRTADTSCCRRRSSTTCRRAACLVEDACATLAGEGRLFGYKYDGFWKPADTFKERAELDADTTRATDRGWSGNMLRTSAHRRNCTAMIELKTGGLNEIAVVGAHCDDIAIGMGGTLLTLAQADPDLRVRGLVLSWRGYRTRGRGAERAGAFCPGPMSSSPCWTCLTAERLHSGIASRTT